MKFEDITENYKNLFKDCIIISDKYQLPLKEIEKCLEEIDNFRVTTPVIGSFSTGKSSMINAILEDNILSTQITPETAVPTEIYYGSNKVFLCNDGNIKEISVDEYRGIELDGNTTRLVKLEYNNDFLEQIEKVKIVDMPGFDSGIELHNKAIDSYLPNSLAYIITFSAEEPVIKESIANFLNELKLHEVPVYIVITKCDKVTSEGLEKCKEFIQNNVPKLLGINDVRIACIQSKRNKNVGQVKEFLLEIEEKSLQIFKDSFSIKLKKSISLIEKYISSRISNKELSCSELEQKEKELEKNISEIMQKLEKEKSFFDNQMKRCIEAIKIKISSDLSAAASSMETMILNGHDIKEKVNLIVRSAVVAGIKSEFEPKLQKYLKNITELINVDIMTDTEVNLDSMKVAADNMVKEVLVKSIPVVFAAIGGILAGPIGAIIGGAVAIFIETFFKSKQERDKRELVRQKVQGEIIPQTADEAGKCIETEIVSYVDQINEEIQSGIEKQKEVMQKSLEDVKKQKQLEEEIQKQKFQELNNDLEKLRGMLNGI